MPAGFTHGDPSPAAVGFAAGGPLDLLPPDPVLAGFVDDAVAEGLDGLSDDELVGLLCSARRLCSWQAAVELAAVAELDRRRIAQADRPGSSRASEHVADELAAALTLTRWSAGALLGLARQLSRLPAVLARLATGVIDRGRAVVFAEELAALDDLAAAAVAAAFTRLAGQMTTGQLRAGIRDMVLAIDPDAARRRRTQARADARVEGWLEGSGNGALAGRELPAAQMIAADKRIDAIARALKNAGAAGSLDQLRAAVFTALLTGSDPDALLAGRKATSPDSAAEPTAGSGQRTAAGPTDVNRAEGSRPATATPETRPASPATNPPATAASPATNPPGTRISPASSAARPAHDVPGVADGTGMSPGLAALGGSVNLVVPLATWLGLSDAPGEAAGYGALDAESSRDLAGRLTVSGRDRWCVTITNPAGRAIGHACARAGPGPGPPGTQWLANLRVAWLEHGDCAHPRMTAAYQPGRQLRHLIQVRQRTCAFPGCRYPAAHTDLDHSVPWDDGGRTCECNLAPLCRTHHRAKQAAGWHLDQPRPGILTWTMPHGRSYTSKPDVYPD